MILGMQKKMDSLGRITIPKEYRDFFHLIEGEYVSVTATKEGIFISNPKYTVVEIPANEKN